MFQGSHCFRKEAAKHCAIEAKSTSSACSPPYAWKRLDNLVARVLETRVNMVPTWTRVD